jgi:MFS transporter, DHA2 family, multidrug resistance protein
MLTVTSEMTVPSVTLPSIGDDLAVSAAATAWVLLAYALPMAAVAIPLGRWADAADVRAVFALAMVGIAAATLVAALAPAFWLVVVGRLLQGVTGALVIAVYMPIITTSVRGDQRGRAIGFVITIMTVGAMAAAPLAGLVADALGWRAVFLMKIPLLAVVLWVGLRTITRQPHRGLPRPGITLLGEAVLLGGAVAAALLAVEEIDGRAPVAAGLGVAAIALAVAWSRLAASRPVLALLRRRAYSVMVVSLLATSFTGGLITFLLPYFVSDVVRGGPDLAGVALLFFVGAMAPLTAIAGALADRLGTTRVALAGSAISVLGMLTMFTLDADAGLVDMAWRLVVLGVGAALFNTAINTAMLAATPPGSEGVGGGVGMTARTIAMTVGPATAALAWTSAGGGIAGFRAGALVITVAAVVGFVALLVPRR